LFARASLAPSSIARSNSHLHNHAHAHAHAQIIQSGLVQLRIRLDITQANRIAASIHRQSLLLHFSRTTVSLSRDTTNDTQLHHGRNTKNHRSPSRVSVDATRNPRPPASRPHNVEHPTTRLQEKAQRATGGEDVQRRPGHASVHAS
jgi:hypothetical protein